VVVVVVVAAAAAVEDVNQLPLPCHHIVRPLVHPGNRAPPKTRPDPGFAHRPADILENHHNVKPRLLLTDPFA
jgi:hypothetical protein